MQGVLLLQLGTPDAPTAKALRPYLRQFLSDPRVIEVPRWKWWLILNLFILPFRPPRSAEKYRRIWDDETGSPLLHLSNRQAELLEARLGVPVRVGMRYGTPSTAEAIQALHAAGAERFVVLPMYPQYSGTTTGSALDGLFDALKACRVVPPFRVVWPYPTHPAYIDALAARITATTEDAPEPEKILISFHGIPQAYVDRGDPYRAQCEQTAHALAARMGWPPERWMTVFQSQFGKDPWLQPYTEPTLEALAKSGVKRVLITNPGFTTDCLETIDEVGFEADEVFRHAGGETLTRVPCLNDHPAWIEAMAALIAPHQDTPQELP